MSDRPATGAAPDAGASGGDPYLDEPPRRTVIRATDEQAFRDQLGKRLHLRRTWLGLSQADIGRKAGVSRNFISAIERGTQGLDAWRLWLVADAIGVTLDWLLYGPNQEATDPEPGYRPYRHSYPPTIDTTPPADRADGTT